MKSKKYSLLLLLFPICTYAQSDWCNDIIYPELKNQCNYVMTLAEPIIEQANNAISDIKAFANEHKSEACAFGDGLSIMYSPLKDNEFCNYELSKEADNAWYHRGQGATSFVVAYLTATYGLKYAYLATKFGVATLVRFPKALAAFFTALFGYDPVVQQIANDERLARALHYEQLAGLNG